jgi:hypothetical protein
MAGMTDEQIWAERVAQWKASGLGPYEFCAGREFAAGELRYHAKQLKRKQRPPAQAKKPRPEPERKYWRESDARAFVEEHARSGLSIATFAEARGIAAQRLKRWRRRFGIRDEIAARHERTKAASVAPAAVRIARVERVAPPATTTTPPGAPLTIEVGRARVCVPAGFDAQTVRAVLDALLASSGGAQ